VTLHDWLNLLLRWSHFIAGIAWIGSSFYFIWLDQNMTAPAKPRERVEGELWMVHSGGFYQVEKRFFAPGELPAHIHWFKWEAALTWITGVALLVVVYYTTAGLYLVRSVGAPIGALGATVIGVALLPVAWLLYDLLWRPPLARHGLAATALSLGLLALVAWGLAWVMSGRGAYMHVGAMLGTLMVANVWLRILPAQREMIAAAAAGREPDYALGVRAKQRSVHNSYMTFPVLFVMLSNHFAATYGHPLAWLVLCLLVVLGMAARHVMIGRGATRGWALAIAAAALAAVGIMTAPARPQASGGGSAAGGDPVPFARVQAILTSRCIACHAAQPSDPTFGPMPGGVSLEQPAEVKRLAGRIRLRAVETETMPLANKTGMTPEERVILGRWIDQGARIDR
jgi:uncharacterized membrane protein